MTGQPAQTLESQERRFALALFFPALAVLLLTTTVPLVYLGWNSLFRLDLSMPWLSGFAGLGNYTKMGSDPRFWNSLLLTLIYTASTVVLQVVIGLSLALLVMQFPRGQGLLRVAAILPIVLAPVVVGLFWRTLVLAPDVGLVDLVTRSLGLGSHNWLGDPQLALISVIAIHTWQWTPFAFLVLLATLATLPGDVYEAAQTRPRKRLAAFPLHHAPIDPSGHRHGAHPAHDDGALGLRGHLRGHGRRAGLGDRNPEPLCLSHVVHRAQSRLRRVACGGPDVDHHRHLVSDVPVAAGAHMKPTAAHRQIALAAVAGFGLAIWVFPVIWGVLTSFKTERDVLAYPPVWLFKPTLDSYREVLFGASSILPNIMSSCVVSLSATVLTMLFAVPASYALARLRYPAKRASGFYVLVTQMLPPVGLIIPYYLMLQKIGWLDTYTGLTVIYLTFSLPFAIWLMVSYFEDIPFEMEEAALLDRAGRLRTLWYVILPQVRGGIAVTAIFVFLNAWNEFMFAVVLGGNRVRPVTVAMFNFISVEQTQWSRLAAGAILAMLPVILIGIFAQRHIVKGLTVGAVKGGGRR